MRDAQRTPEHEAERTREEKRPVQVATDGVGPLYQRDWLLKIEECPVSPEQALLALRRNFPDYSPELLAGFKRPDGGGELLEEGDTMHVRLTGGGHAGVVAVAVEERSLTLRTQSGHMESGRVTFAATQDEDGALVLRIRTRARIRDVVRSAAYELGGKAVQSTIWSQFLKSWAQTLGGKVVGDVTEHTEEVEDDAADRGEVDVPTLAVEAPDRAA
ncbi:MAG: hypothetical protein ACK47B_24810 [Armatimonadota bacterium]